MRRIRYHIILILMGSLLTSCILENGAVSSVESQVATLRVELSGRVVSDSSSSVAASGSTSSSVARTFCDTSLSAVLGSSTLRRQTAALSSTKVSLRSFSENNVSDLHVMVYNNEGSLTGHAYSSGGSVNVTTRSGEDCSVYALVNTNDESMVVPSTESSLQALTTPTLTAVEDIKVNGNLIMSGSVTTDITAGTNTLGSFTVCRLPARNILNITCGEGITLTGYAIRNLPVKSWYVARPNTAEADEDDAAVGDDAVDPDVSADWLDTETFPGTDILTGTGTLTGTTYALTFYQYENRRGGRKSISGTTGDATDQTQKATYAPDRATCIEFYVNAGGTSITYQLCLGASASNYNVKRNGSYTYILFIGASGLSVSSVSIEPYTNATTEAETEL